MPTLDENFQPNEKPLVFELSGDQILVEVENSLRGLFWRMTVNGYQSHVCAHYQGILVHQGYGLVTDYFATEDLPAYTPFKMFFAEKVTT